MFPLFSHSCGIDIGDGTFVITGGYKSGTETQSVMYRQHGFVTNLHPLLIGRHKHACSKFQDSAGQTVGFMKRKIFPILPTDYRFRF